MSSVSEKQARLVNALIKSNQRGKLLWKPFEGDPNCVFTEVNDKMIYIDDHREDETDSIKLEIYTRGSLADSFLDDDLSSSGVASITGETWFATMTGLLQSARRKATGADEVLDSLLKDLGE